MEYIMKPAKLMLTGLLLISSSSTFAAPSSLVIWDSETRNIVKSGDIGRGEALAKPCASCHGAEGIAPSPNWPSLAGQLATYTYKQLQDYKGGHRADGIMRAMSSALSNQDMADIAAFYASKNLPTGNNTAIPTPVLVQKGDGKRLIPGCDLCHGRGGIGAVVDVPALAGQKAAYFTKTMKAFKNNSRKNDIYHRMRIIAEQLSEAEIRLIADYYASVTP